MHANCGHVNGKVERSRRIDAEEFCRLLDGVVEDDTGLFNQKLKERNGRTTTTTTGPTAGLAAKPLRTTATKTRAQPVTGQRHHTRSVDAVSTQDSNLRRR